MSTFSASVPLYTQEYSFKQAINDQIHDFWQKKESGTLRTKDKKHLYWCKFTDPRHSKSLLVLNGRIESCIKYQELFYELYQQGYNIYSYDHRGQGLSDRLTDNPQIGYVEWFDDYVDDLDAVIHHFDLAENSNTSILAHSMGCAVALRYLQTHSCIFKSAVLASPMLGFNVPPHLRLFALPYTQLKATLPAKPQYVTGYGDYFYKPFENNPLTHSEIRYRWYRELYEANEELKLGGPSYRWVWQSMMAVKQCYLMSRHITLPILMLQATQDGIVNNAAQNRFFQKLKKTNKQAQFKAIEGARHELFYEIDTYRDKALQVTLSFLKQYQD
ncbi:alpha/beta fold hydrolase [Vibrio sp.]|uniref:Alpha/beta fold hydrolase n=1 Tax=Vibrio viridaestus TaxID=2487322 RepID=A0A3N9TX45_9VIBR|nr:alpha/beta fold hydrolase [Vibrio viridaestus]MDC0611229.1 alpha/beta fold hydrolase [Vibrio sp.]RQW61492.1 alpha/beta fold hydrolase [Vibrio viridaestus]